MSKSDRLSTLLILALLALTAVEPAFGQIAGIGAGAGTGPFWALLRLLFNIIFIPIVGLSVLFGAIRLMQGNHGVEALGLVAAGACIIAFWEQITNLFISGAQGVGGALGLGG